MTMAPGQRKRSFWLEFVFISILLFLLMGARSQQGSRESSLPNLVGGEVHRALLATPVALK